MDNTAVSAGADDVTADQRQRNCEARRQISLWDRPSSCWLNLDETVARKRYGARWTSFRTRGLAA